MSLVSSPEMTVWLTFGVFQRMFYTHPDGTKYLLNLLDTPGHADFSSELLRSLLPSQGALLLVDAAQVCKLLQIPQFHFVDPSINCRVYKLKLSVSWRKLENED